MGILIVGTPRNGTIIAGKPRVVSAMRKGSSSSSSSSSSSGSSNKKRKAEEDTCFIALSGTCGPHSLLVING